MLNKAIEIAAKAHRGQFDKGGNPYILHPLRVMLNCESEYVKICAVLHDVIEDTDITLNDLKEQGFNNDIIAALHCLTKQAGETYDDFIARILPNKIACEVKLADLIDNMDLTRIPNPSEKDEARIKKYQRAIDQISDTMPYAAEIPDCRLIEVNGVAEIHPAISGDRFCDMFVRFIEMHGWFFGGDIQDITDKEQEN
jgi:(p)ppGpp synthase/HD superfamily hydrolase